jgi:hypothetical protein
MPKPNYAFQKRQRELQKKQKKEAKKAQKAAENQVDTGAEATPGTDTESPAEPTPDK